MPFEDVKDLVVRAARFDRAQPKCSSLGRIQEAGEDATSK